MGSQVNTNGIGVAACRMVGETTNEYIHDGKHIIPSFSDSELRVLIKYPGCEVQAEDGLGSCLEGSQVSLFARVDQVRKIGNNVEMGAYMHYKYSWVLGGACNPHQTR
jgi:hypothetical protein